MKSYKYHALFSAIICSVLLPALTFGQGYKIKIQIRNLSQGTIKLAYYYGDKQYVKDTAIVDKRGAVEFAGKEPLEKGIYLVVLPNTRYFEIILDKEQKFSLETDTTDLVGSMKFTGTADNEAFYNYLREINGIQKEMEALKTKLESAADKDAVKVEIQALEKQFKDSKLHFIDKHPNAFISKVFLAAYEPEIPEAPILSNGRKDSTFAFRYYKKHYFDKIDMKDERLIRTPVLANKVKTYIEKLTPQIPDSINQAADFIIGLTDGKNELYKWVVYWVTNTYEKSNIMGMDAVFVHMAKNYYLKGRTPWVDSSQTAKIRDRVESVEPNLIGRIAPNLKLFRPDFRPIALHDVKSSYTILYFWDPSCGHCQKVTPKLMDFYKKNKKEFDLEVFAVYTETDTTEWFKAIKEKELDWTNAADLMWNNNFKKKYDIYSTPVIYVLDRNKKIIAKRMDVDQIEDFLKNHRKLAQERQ